MSNLLTKLHKIKVLNAEEESILIDKMIEGDTKAREQIITHNLKLVPYIINHRMPINVRNSQYFSYDDLFQVGIIGLTKGIDSYDKNKSKLSTYLGTCISNEIRMFLRKYTKHYENNISIDNPLSDLQLEEVVTIGDTLAIPDEELPQVVAMQNVLKEQLMISIDRCLDEREKYIIKERFLIDKPLTQDKLAKKLNISRSLISRIEVKAIKKLQTDMRKLPKNNINEK